MPVNDSPDLLILGAGSTALAATQRAVELGARVTVIEQAVPGGTCINWGCVPSKTLIHKAALYYAARRGASAGLNLTPGPVDCQALMGAKQRAIERVRAERCDGLLDGHPSVRLVRGHGRFLGPGEIQVGGRLKAEFGKILAEPFEPVLHVMAFAHREVIAQKDTRNGKHKIDQP